MTPGERKKSRHTRAWSVRRFVGSIFQRLAWRLCDPHDSWMIEYRDHEDRACCCVRTAHYNQALVMARELKGRITGCNVQTVDAPEWN